MLRVLPVFLVVVKGGPPHEAAPDLPVQRAVRQANLDGQFPEGTAPEGGEPKIAVVGHGDLLAVFER